MKFQALIARRRQPDALFSNQGPLRIKILPLLLETIGLGEPTINLRDFTLYNVRSKRRSCRSARCASAANACHQ
jgi:hypothetical protein